MGIPIKDINSFERRLKSRTKRWTLIIFANAESDSKAVDYVLRNFHLLDTFSDDVDFFMPGYEIRGRIGFSQPDIEIRKHLAPLYFPEYAEFDKECVKFIESPRLGQIAFYQAELVDFALELTRRNPSYFYGGVCQMVLIPVVSGRPDYTGAAVFNLDAIINTPSKISLELFFTSVFNLIRKAGEPSKIRTRLEKLIGWQSSVVKEIKQLYKEATTMNNCEDWYVKYYEKAIKSLEKHLGWSLEDEYYFVSYSSKNLMKANLLKQYIEKEGYHVWMAPDGIPQGTEYSQMIPTALKFASHFVLLLTPASAESGWVRRELDMAINYGAKIKVVLGDGFTIKDMRRDDELRFFLNRVQIRYEYNDIISSQFLFNVFLND
jgi:hypothetical protein